VRCSPSSVHLSRWPRTPYSVPYTTLFRSLYVIIVGGVDTGWTFYTPFSTQYSNTHVFGTTFAGFLAGFSSILTGLNFMVTIHRIDRKSTRLNSSHQIISYAVFCLKKKNAS